MSRNLEFSISEYYHLYNRGTEKRKIFLDDKDRERFLRLLYLCNTSKSIVFRDTIGLPLSAIDKKDVLVDIGCYCLMNNHFHLLIKEKIEEGISIYLGKLCTAYSMYFNIKYKRTGKLFEGSFKASHVDRDEYLKYLFAYIHLNPVKLLDSAMWKEKRIINTNGIKTFLKNYRYSSYLDYIGVNREERLILNKKVFPEYFETKKDFENFVKDWMEYEEE
ncbi:MAG: hypothetical protein Athens071416_369 [Parcubacteria group bacterium Athens0714_16]|nr:MAG: hypothetical protein Athens071416_369 [Parcubacteria group bacterium Athens0714_16]